MCDIAIFTIYHDKLQFFSFSMINCNFPRKTTFFKTISTINRNILNYITRYFIYNLVLVVSNSSNTINWPIAIKLTNRYRYWPIVIKSWLIIIKSWPIVIKFTNRYMIEWWLADPNLTTFSLHLLDNTAICWPFYRDKFLPLSCTTQPPSL